MKILVLGCKGQLGRCLFDQLKNTDHKVLFTSREQIDISDFELTKNQVIENSPDVIINASAYTEVDKAEEDQQTADLINHLAVGNLAKVCNLLGILLIHISTDYVFDGDSDRPYNERDQLNPLGHYGLSKLNGEQAIQLSGCKHIIIRTAWVYSEYGNNFLKTMLRLGTERDELRIVGDQIGCPTYAQDIAKAIVSILQKPISEKKILGMYHFGGELGCSWADFAEDIFKEAINQDIMNTMPKVSRITTAEFPTLAKRPMQSQLDCAKFKAVFGINPSNYKDGIHSALAVLKK